MGDPQSGGRLGAGARGKRPYEATISRDGKEPRLTTASMSVFSSTPAEALPEDVSILLGTYTETGTNHGRKVFEKQEDDGEPVSLYYWDTRDGAEFSGWFFGDRTGGAQVYARCPQSGMMPPQS